jgi:arabinan endo-1,5-alpha-L-arabinosidase
MLNKVLLFFIVINLCGVAKLRSQDLKQNIGAHDPVMIKSNGRYYLYCTGRGITVWSSTDRISWKSEPSVFSSAPAWAMEAVPGFRGHIWAPDISFYKGRYYLFYSVSMFGKNTSAIGVATSLSLNPSDATYQWIDHGLIIKSEAGKTNWNAIDPNIIQDQDGIAWLSFGSFWSGLKMIRLTPDRLQIDGSVSDLRSIASRGNATNAIEAPFIFKKNNYFYLFASIDFCCRGKESTYKIIVGRSRNVTGPFVDDKNILLNKGGGRLILEGNSEWYGVGHNAVANFDGKDYLIFHGYSAADKGIPKLLVRTLKWSQGWPVSSEL